MGELIVNGIKIAFTIAIAATFMVAVQTLINLVTMFVQTSVVGEVFGIFSACLPFDLSAVMSGIANAGTAILAFMVANKIWALTSNRIKI